MQHTFFKTILTTSLIFLLSLSTVGAQEFVYAGWIPRWSPESGYESVKKNKNILGEISPMWYKLNNDGSLHSYRPANEASYKKLAKDNGILLIPTVAAFDYAILHDVLSSEENFDRQIISIVNEVTKRGYDGIDLDYESILYEDKAKFFEFLEILSSKLQEKNKKLYVTVLAKWGNIKYTSLPQTREVQDWSKIAKYADVIRIMAYDYTYSGSSHPGPIGPLSWHKRILDYAVTELPKEKIQMGIHMYGYQWERPATKSFFDKDITELIAERNFSNTGSYVSIGAQKLMDENKGGKLEEHEGEKFYRYQADDKDRVLVFSDDSTVAARNKLAQSYGIRGVSYWSFGGDEEILASSLNITIANEQDLSGSNLNSPQASKKTRKEFIQGVAETLNLQAVNVLGITSQE